MEDKNTIIELLADEKLAGLRKLVAKTDRVQGRDMFDQIVDIAAQLARRHGFTFNKEKRLALRK